MPGHTVLAIAVQVAKYAVEVLACKFLKPLPDPGQFRSPGERLQTDTRIPIAGAWIAIPGLQAGNGEYSALDADVLLAPLKVVRQLLEQGIGFLRRKETGKKFQLPLFYRDGLGLGSRSGE